MNEQPDNQLLANYLVKRSETAFAELVRRHVNLVYSAALRMTCDSHAAQDVTQAVFVLLAQQAAQLTSRPALEGWLHTTTRNLSAKHVRSDARRRAREKEAALMNELISHEPDTNWEQIAPLLDEALGALDEEEREVLLLRYFKSVDLRTVGKILGISDDAAQKRVSRAIEHLRIVLAKRGVTAGVSGLTIAIAANAVQAAPAGLAVASSSTALLAGTKLAATTAILMTTVQKTIVGATLAIVLSTGIYEAVQISKARSEIKALREQQSPLVDQVQQLRLQRDDAMNKLVALQDDNSVLNRRVSELIKLRASDRSRNETVKSEQSTTESIFLPTRIPASKVSSEELVPQVTTITSPVVQGSGIDISGTVYLKGTPPAERENVGIRSDVACGKLHTEPVMTRFYVVGENRGLGDVFITLKGINTKSDGEVLPPVVIDQRNCEYEPYIFALQTNQRIIVRNLDPVMHNVHPMPLMPGNKESNKAQMAGGPDLTFSFSSVEVFLKFSCQVHPWMFAYACVVDHPYFAVTDKNGKYAIRNVPPGTYTMEIYHRKAAPVSAPIKTEIKVSESLIKDFTLEAK